MTLKGLAFGAGISLVVSGLATVPATAAGNGQVGFVTLAADGGTHTNVLTTDTLDLKANFSPAVNEVSGRFLKFLVTDPNSTSRVDASRTNTEVTPITDATAASSSGVVTLTKAALLISGAKFVGYGATATTLLNDVIYTGQAGDGTATATIAGSGTVANIDETGLVVEAAAGKSTRTGMNAVSLGNVLEPGYALASSIGGTATTNGRTTSGSYVVTTNIFQAGADVILRLSSNSADTQTHVVTAWIDANGNNVIDDTEYASPDVTVKFLKPTDVSPTVTLDPIGINDLSVRAQVTFSPELNMTQTGDVQVTFTRQGFSEALVATGDNNIENAVRVGTTSTWAAAITMYNTATNDPWTYTVPGSTTAATAEAKSGTRATLTKAAHGLVVGDVVTVTTDGGNGGLNTSAAVIISKTDDTFTYDVGNTNTSDATVNAVYKKIGTAATAGTYSAQAILDGILVGSAVFQSTGTTSVAALENEVQIASGVASDGAVRVGNKSDITIVSYSYKSDDTAAAGVPVLVTATAVSTAGTILVNGIKAAANGTWNLTTDAAGEVKLVVSNSSAVVGEGITLQVRTQGQTATTTLTWTAAIYKLYDLNVLNGWQPVRTVVEGGSYTFKLALLDQWKEAPTSGAYRVLMTTDNRTRNAGYVDLVNGRADFTFTDGKIGTTMYSDLQADIEVKAATATSFSTYRSGASDWDDAFNATQVDGDDVVRIYVIATQTDAIVLDASGASLYDYNSGSVNALFVGNLAAKATVARDGATTQVARPDYVSAPVVINGKVQNSVSAVGRAGAVVTISGAADLLFSVGETDRLGSITTVADKDGHFTVKVWSNKTQTDTVVTMTTPNGASKTQKISFNKPAVTAVKAIEFTGPTSARPGSTFTVVGKLVDAFGNGVDLDLDNSGVVDGGTFLVTYTGPGVSFGALPVTTDDKGEARVGVLLGTNDSGTATVTITWDRDGTGTTYSAISKTQTVTVGTVSGVAGTSVKRTGNTVDVRVTGYAKSRIVLNGARVASRSTLGTLSKTVNLRAGRNVIQIVVDGKVIRTVRYTR